MSVISYIIRSLHIAFSPSYLYTLDKSLIHETTNFWIFKEFGTHTYIVKTWKQLQDGNLLCVINPKDISYIAQIEARKEIEHTYLRISEEMRGGIYILSNGYERLSVTGYDFLKDEALVRKMEHQDIIRIAYRTGVEKGRQISNIVTEKMASSESKESDILKIVK